MPSRTSFWVVPRKRVHLHVGTDPIWQHRPHSYAWGSFNTWIWKARRVQKQTKFWWWGCSEPGQRAFSPPILYLCGWGSGRPTPLGGLKLLSSCCCIKITFSLWFACGLTLLGKKYCYECWVLSVPVRIEQSSNECWGTSEFSLASFFLSMFASAGL